MNNRNLPSDLITIVLEYVPSCILVLLKANNGYNKLILQCPKIWRHFSFNLYADLSRIVLNNPLIDLESISIPKTPWFLHYQSHKQQISKSNRNTYQNEEGELIYLNIYISIETMNEIILDWLGIESGITCNQWHIQSPFVDLFIPIQYVKKIRVLCSLSHIKNTLNFLGYYLSNIKPSTAAESRLQIDMDCFMHVGSNSATPIPFNMNQHNMNEIQSKQINDLLSIKNLIVDNCDLIRQFSMHQSKLFHALPNLECLTLCTTYVSFYSSALNTIHSMLFSSQYQPFHRLWTSFRCLKTIIISEKNSDRLYTDLRNTRTSIRFPPQIKNLWFPHSKWFDLCGISYLNVLCLDPFDMYTNVVDKWCMMDEIKLSTKLTINHLFLNVTSVTWINSIGHSNFVNNLMNMSYLLDRAENVTFCNIPESMKNTLQAIIPSDKHKNVNFISNVKLFQKEIHTEIGIMDVFDNEYEYMMHNKTIRDQQAQICHLDIIDDILGSFTYVS